MKTTVLIACLAAALSAALPVAAKPGLFAQPWIDGTRADEPQSQTQRYDRDTYVIRQSLHATREAPFLYLLFGKDRALLLDTGDGGMKIRPTVDAAIDQWLAERHRASIPLVVAHSHSHQDHIQGDAEFQARPDTTVVGLKPPQIARFFHLSHWPTTPAVFDLGGRKLDIIPTPGHHPSHIMAYDERTHLLLSGDALYPGRLYVPANTFAEDRDSIDRVVAFTRRHPVSYVLGAHIEMSQTPGKDFVLDAPTHPDEHALELPYADLLALQSALHGMGDKVVRDVHPDFIVFPLPPRPPQPDETVPAD